MARVTRRQALARIGATLAGLAAVPAIVAACEEAAPSGPVAAVSPPPGTEPVPSDETSLGSNASDPVPRQAMQAVIDAFAATTGIEVRINTADAGTFQDQISAYLQGTPDDVFSWFGGYRMRFFAARGLAGDLSAVWDSIGGNFADAFRAASTGDDGRQYLVPFTTYPWVVIHRRSLFEERGYRPPETIDDLVALAERMRADGLVPFAFGDLDGWPAMGTFDILDMRLNGHDFHIGLLAGRERWTDPRVRTVFETWRGLLPYHQEGALGRTWQDAAQTMIAKRAGMYFLGTFAAEQATEEERADLDFFPFPLLGTEWDDERAIDGPINGFMMSRSPRNPAAARRLLEFLGSGEAQDIYLEANPSRIATAQDADASGYTPFQRKSAEIMARAGRIAQFFDRDTRPDFAGPNGMQGLLQRFLGEPDLDLDPYLADIQAFWDSLTD